VIENSLEFIDTSLRDKSYTRQKLSASDMRVSWEMSEREASSRNSLRTRSQLTFLPRIYSMNK